MRQIGLMLGVMMLACIHSAFALSNRISVTPATQVEQGIVFTLTTMPEHDNTIIVRLEIPKKGKLQNLGGLQVELSDGKMTLLLSPLATTEHDGTITASFQISNYLMPGCYINLCVAVDPLFSITYAVKLKDYIPDKQ